MNQNRDFLSYLNGRVMPHSRVVAELQRQDTETAGGYYDAERTFNSKVFKLRSHLERLYNGLNHSQIDPGITIEEMEETTLALVEANSTLLNPGEELTISQVVGLTKMPLLDDALEVNVIIYCQLLDFTTFAQSYFRGVRLVTPATYGLPEQPANAKDGGQQQFPLMTNADGIITECQGANFMFVKDGRIKLPDRSNVLPGVSMYTVLELAESLNIPVDEGEYSPYDVYTSDEAFVSSTRYCMLPVATINGYTLTNELPGPTTSQILSAWKDAVGMDFVQQALDSV